MMRWKRPWPRWAILVLVCSVVLAFRTAAWLNPSPIIEIPPALSGWLNGLGLLFLGCGVWAWSRRPSPLAGVFLLYAAGMGIHWGGTIGSSREGVQVALVTFYAAATILADGAFLDLASRYPADEHRRGLRSLALYLPAIIVGLAIPVAPYLPREGLEAALAAVFGLAFLFSLAAGIVFLARWARSSPKQRVEHSLTWISLAVLVSSVIDLLGEARVLPGPADAWKLAYGLVPLTLAWAIAAPERQDGRPLFEGR